MALDLIRLTASIADYLAKPSFVRFIENKTNCTFSELSLEGSFSKEVLNARSGQLLPYHVLRPSEFAQKLARRETPLACRIWDSLSRRTREHFPEPFTNDFEFCATLAHDLNAFLSGNQIADSQAKSLNVSWKTPVVNAPPEKNLHSRVDRTLALNRAALFSHFPEFIAPSDHLKLWGEAPGLERIRTLWEFQQNENRIKHNEGLDGISLDSLTVAIFPAGIEWEKRFRNLCTSPVMSTYSGVRYTISKEWFHTTGRFAEIAFIAKLRDSGRVGRIIFIFAWCSQDKRWHPWRAVYDAQLRYNGMF